jgi:hypothetical protein
MYAQIDGFWRVLADEAVGFSFVVAAKGFADRRNKLLFSISWLVPCVALIRLLSDRSRSSA